MQRWKHDACGEMRRWSDGEWVRHAEAEAELSALRARVAELEAAVQSALLGEMESTARAQAAEMRLEALEAPPVMPEGWWVQLDDDGTLHEWSLWMRRGLDRVEMARCYNPPDMRIEAAARAGDITPEFLQVLRALAWAIEHNTRPPHASDGKETP